MPSVDFQKKRRSMMNAKIKSLRELKKIIAQQKRRKKKVVFTNGCFDILHYGHVKYLQDAKGMGDILVVGINSDSSVKKIKGDKRPLVNEKDRSRILAALSSVDFVVIFKEDNPLKIIKSIQPDILIKGSDWSQDKIVGSDFVLNYGGRVARIQLVDGRSTTGLIKKIVQTF